jgi:hypothetical protein
VRSFNSIVPHTLNRARQISRALLQTGRRSLVLGTILLGASAASVLAASNTPPDFVTVTASASVVEEGQPFVITGTFTDPDVADRHMIQVWWTSAAGGEKTYLAPGQKSFQISHVYPDQGGPYQVRVTVADRQLPPLSNDNTTGGSGTDTVYFPVQVKNAAPKLPEPITVTQRAVPNGIAVVLEGDVIDGSGDPLQVFAYWDTGARPLPGACAISEGKTARHYRCERVLPVSPFSAPRNVTVWISAQDDDGLAGKTSKTFQIPDVTNSSVSGPAPR